MTTYLRVLRSEADPKSNPLTLERGDLIYAVDDVNFSSFEEFRHLRQDSNSDMPAISVIRRGRADSVCVPKDRKLNLDLAENAFDGDLEALKSEGYKAACQDDYDKAVTQHLVENGRGFPRRLRNFLLGAVAFAIIYLFLASRGIVSPGAYILIAIAGGLGYLVSGGMKAKELEQLRKQLQEKGENPPQQV